MTRLEDLSEEEIRRRIPVWTALAEFYLDNDLEDTELMHIARRIRKAGYTLPEAKAMLKYEVGPVFIRNGLGAPGRWGLWLEDEVHELVVNRLKNFRVWERIPYWRDIWYRFQTFWFDEYWQKVEEYYAASDSGR